MSAEFSVVWNHYEVSARCNYDFSSSLACVQTPPPLKQSFWGEGVVCTQAIPIFPCIVRIFKRDAGKMEIA